VLGNGTSRLQLNHKNLLDKGIVYACNAVYREFEPHHLIAVDVKMVNEIIASGYHKRHKDIYIFGFDYQGLQGKFNNVYADTYNYKKSNDAATFHGNWLSQTERTIKDFKNTQYYRVINPGDFIPDQLSVQLKNIKHITYEEFGKKFPDCTYTTENHQKATI